MQGFDESAISEPGRNMFLFQCSIFPVHNIKYKIYKVLMND